MQISSTIFGTIENTEVKLFILKNNNGVEVKFTNYGGIITSIITPDKNRDYQNIVLGFDKLDHYLSKKYLDSYPYFGAIIGRFGNRISNGKFSLKGIDYKLSTNNSPNHIHGGFKGFDKIIWKAKPFKNKNLVGVELTYLSIDGEEGYPGNLQLKITYSLTEENEFTIDYFAETDKATPINLTQHSYFNLGNEPTILNHQLQLNCEKYTETDSDSIPTGKILSVKNTPLDFRKIKTLKKDIDYLEIGYDNNYCLNNDTGKLIKAGKLIDNKSGRIMEVYTTEVGIQLYTGKFIPELIIDGLKKFGAFSGVALETQHYPDSVNHPNFPSTILHPQEKYQQKTIYKFSAKD
ncbi:MAG: galactose mutarotase [Flavobacteriaceae bacterium]|nr:galactose mutarotase [Flavobacteriaceae bacterium]